MGSILIETRDITKKFGDFTANDKINIAVEEGEIKMAKQIDAMGTCCMAS